MGQTSNKPTYRDVGPVELGLNGVTLAEERTSNSIGADGFTQLTVQVVATRGSYTALLFAIDISLDNGTTFTPIMTQAVSSGAITLSNGAYTFTTSTTDSMVVNGPINYPFIRLRIDGTAGDSTDSVLVYMRLSTQ